MAVHSHRVARGDTLSALAERFSTTVGTLVSLNKIKDVDRIRVGMLLKIPSHAPAVIMGRSTHTVAAGETLSQIAARNGTTVHRLATLNGLKDPDRLRAGTVLRLPAASGTSVVTHVDGSLDGTELQAIMPHLRLAKRSLYLPFLNAAMREGRITRGLRMAAFLAQLAHESVELRYFEEIASGAAYEGRVSLGNTHPGDGRRFKGRGPIQLTGRSNYAAASKALGLDLLARPTDAARPEIGFRVAQWFWTSRGLNELADARDFTTITKRVNGGTRGLRSRTIYYERAKRVLGA